MGKDWTRSLDCFYSRVWMNCDRHWAIEGPPVPDRQLMLFCRYINEHLERDIKLADLAQLLGMSKFHFSRMFKRAIGRAPCQYPIQQRIEGAKLLLKQKERSIKEARSRLFDYR
ncbi:AraC family transcriptional regulator [Microcoleus sp. herbarium19]|uniref:AraC family transcriptional regulator n=1 Tax=unclassified Microcoleus TaxID=2642155 RepID=UPI002FD387C3